MYEIQQLYDELDEYRHFNLWQFGNIICAVCDPAQSAYFELGLEKTTFRISLSDCDEFNQSKYFEVRLMKFLHNFVKPFAHMLLCYHKKDIGTENEIISLNFQDVTDLEKRLESCAKDQLANINDCLGACKHNIFAYTPPFHMIELVQQINKALFEYLGHSTMEEYYKNYKKRPM